MNIRGASGPSLTSKDTNYSNPLTNTNFFNIIFFKPLWCRSFVDHLGNMSRFEAGTLYDCNSNVILKKLHETLR